MKTAYAIVGVLAVVGVTLAVAVVYGIVMLWIILLDLTGIIDANWLYEPIS